MIPQYHADLSCPSLSPSARHGDGLYDSYMRTDHILKDEADTNSPSGLPPMPKHTVSIHTNKHTHTCMHRASKAVLPVLKHTLSPDILFLRERDSPHSLVPIHSIYTPPFCPQSFMAEWEASLLSPTFVIQSSFMPFCKNNMGSRG